VEGWFEVMTWCQYDSSELLRVEAVMLKRMRMWKEVKRSVDANQRMITGDVICPAVSDFRAQSK
jgi:hypothetical protein